MQRCKEILATCVLKDIVGQSFVQTLIRFYPSCLWVLKVTNKGDVRVFILSGFFFWLYLVIGCFVEGTLILYFDLILTLIWILIKQFIKIHIFLWPLQNNYRTWILYRTCCINKQQSVKRCYLVFHLFCFSSQPFREKWKHHWMGKIDRNPLEFKQSDSVHCLSYFQIIEKLWKTNYLLRLIWSFKSIFR